MVALQADVAERLTGFKQNAVVQFDKVTCFYLNKAEIYYVLIFL